MTCRFTRRERLFEVFATDADVPPDISGGWSKVNFAAVETVIGL